MRIRTIGSLALSISTLAVLVTSGMAYAQQPIKKLTPSAARVVKPASLDLPCDVSISYIQYFNCPCNINLDAYYVDKYLSVKLFNESTLKPTVELKVKYFDMMQNRLLTITRNVTFNGRGSKNVVIHNNRPMLIKKSYGVQAEVALKSTNMHDPDMSNNQQTQLICGPVVE